MRKSIQNATCIAATSTNLHGKKTSHSNKLYNPLIIHGTGILLQQTKNQSLHTTTQLHIGKKSEKNGEKWKPLKIVGPTNPSKNPQL